MPSSIEEATSAAGKLSLKTSGKTWLVSYGFVTFSFSKPGVSVSGGKATWNWSGVSACSLRSTSMSERHATLAGARAQA